MSRYIERAENTARLLNVYSLLMLDLPRGVGIHWRQLIEITGTHELYSVILGTRAGTIIINCWSTTNPWTLFDISLAMKQSITPRRWPSTIKMDRVTIGM